MRSVLFALGIILLAAQAARGGAPLGAEIRTGLKDGRTMVFVPAGKFIQGTRKGPPEERPQRTIYLDAFWIDRNEVTVRAWQRFRKETGHRPAKYRADPRRTHPELPAVGMSWDGAAAYCKWAGKRLPTESEWEKAARGPDGRIYPWGDAFDPAKVAAGGKGPGLVGRRPAGASPYGALGMSGNVWEWTHDFWGEFYLREAPARNPKGPATGFLHTIKGGSWMNQPAMLRAATRFRLDAIVRWKLVGFRCAVDAK